MRKLLLLLPLLFAFSTGTVLFEQTQLFRDPTLPFVADTFIPPLLDPTCMRVEIEGEAFHQVQMVSSTDAVFALGERRYGERASFRPDIGGPSSSDPLLQQVIVQPPIVSPVIPAGQVLTLTFIVPFSMAVDVADPTIIDELEDGAAVEWAANSTVGPAESTSGPGNWAYRTRSTHTLRGLVRVTR
jgi:hypothetical protein